MVAVYRGTYLIKPETARGGGGGKRVIAEVIRWQFRSRCRTDSCAWKFITASPPLLHNHSMDTRRSVDWRIYRLSFSPIVYIRFRDVGILEREGIFGRDKRFLWKVESSIWSTGFETNFIRKYRSIFLGKYIFWVISFYISRVSCNNLRYGLTY